MNVALRQILVHLDATEASGARLRAARLVAQQHAATLTALYAASPSFVELAYAPMIEPTVAATLAEVDEQRRQRARQAFDEVAADKSAATGVNLQWAETTEVPIIPAFAQQAFHADLLVLGQHNPTDTSAAALPPDFTQSVVIASGKPALVMPHVGTFPTIGETACIAWKPTREAARAVAAALPLLQRARRVHVLQWGAQERPAVQGQRLDLQGYLRLHGIETQWHREGPEPDGMGEMILSRLCDLEGDLLVMGCYGHSRARELVMGGVSRTVLQSMTVPTLMSH